MLNDPNAGGQQSHQQQEMNESAERRIRHDPHEPRHERPQENRHEHVASPSLVNSILNQCLAGPRGSCRFGAITMNSLLGVPSRSGAYVYAGKRVEESENIQQPKNHGDHHHCVQNGFDRSLHRYEPIDEPEKQADHNQHQNDLK
jgi:hypothetical protein